MGQHCGQIAWVLEREHHQLKKKVNFPHLVDFLNLGNGNGKRNLKNSKLHHDVSIFLKLSISHLISY